MATSNPKNVTIKGRLSFPRLTYNQALEANKTSKFPKANDKDVSPEFNLLLEQAQLDKLVNHIRSTFIPYVQEQTKKGEKRDALEPKLVTKLEKLLDSGDWDDQPPFLPIKTVHEKTAAMAPEVVASVKVIGPKAADLDLRATVFSEDQLLVPDPDILTWPVARPIKDTVFTPYPGAHFVSTLSLAAFYSSNSIYGISAYANVAFYRGDIEGERFGGGGVSVDDEEIFLDD